MRRVIAAKKFHATLRPRLDAEISKVIDQMDQEEARRIGTEKADGLFDDAYEYTEGIVQDGVAKPTKLGGWMRLKAKWIKD